ncbi:MAG TPA: sodium:proton antiporter, partial [Microvirga sp.]|nr:sodium:proton antiporter [Microvirga sp.]
MHRKLCAALTAAALTVLPQTAFAAELDGATLSPAWALPFAGILLSIALFPLMAHHFWEHHQGKIAALWGLLVLVPMAVVAGPMTAIHA